MASAAQARQILDSLKDDVAEVKQAVLDLTEAGKRPSEAQKKVVEEVKEPAPIR